MCLLSTFSWQHKWVMQQSPLWRKWPGGDFCLPHSGEVWHSPSPCEALFSSGFWKSRPECHSTPQTMAVTPHDYLPLRSTVKQGYSPSVQTPDPVETSTLWLPGNLRVCSLSSWSPTVLPTQVPTSFLPSLPSHQKIHTHTNIIFSPFVVYFNRSLQFTTLVWEWVFSWLAISKKADLWRHNSKLSDLFYSVAGCPDYSSPEYLILGCQSLPSLLILPRSFTLPHILAPFSALIQCLTCRGTEKRVWFSCFLSLLRMSGIWSDFLSRGSL